MTETPLTALTCDADPDTLTVISRLVTDAGYELVGASDKAVDLINLARMLQPRLVVIDQDLPYLTGLMALPEIREVAPGCEVLLLTRDESVHADAMRAGAFGVVYKTRLAELSGALGRARQFLESATGRDPADRRTGKDRRQRQDWNRVTSERRSGIDRRHPPDADSTTD